MQSALGLVWILSPSTERALFVCDDFPYLVFGKELQEVADIQLQFDLKNISNRNATGMEQEWIFDSQFCILMAPAIPHAFRARVDFPESLWEEMSVATKFDIFMR